jgi:hypothetical protein
MSEEWWGREKRFSPIQGGFSIEVELRAGIRAGAEKAIRDRANTKDLRDSWGGWRAAEGGGLETE